MFHLFSSSSSSPPILLLLRCPLFELDIVSDGDRVCVSGIDTDERVHTCPRNANHQGVNLSEIGNSKRGEC